LPDPPYSIWAPADTTCEVQPLLGVEEDGDPVEEKAVP
jgi:hypothetical protein